MSGRVEVICAQCGATKTIYRSRQHPRNFCNRTCQGAWRSANLTNTAAAHWKGGERRDRGRVFWHIPWHPDANSRGYVERARIVAELTLRRPLLPGEIVHHKDGIADNDHPDNLEVLTSQAEHARLHGRQRTPEQMASMRAARRSVAA